MRFFSKLAAAALVSTFALTGAAQAIELKLASIAPKKSIWAFQIQRYADKVAELSGGDIKINTFFNGQLGNMGDTLKNTLSGRNDIWVGATPVLGAVTGEFQIFTLPYVFNNTKEVTCIVPKMTDRLRKAAGKKFHYLAPLAIGSQAIASDKPMLTPADIKGYKVRTAPLKSSIELFKSLGATPLPIAAAETPAAASTGLVNALDFGIVYYVLTGSNKPLPIYTRTDQIYNLGAFVFSAKSWAKLTAGQKAILDKAMPELEFGRLLKELTGFEQKMFALHKKTGGKVIDLTPEQHAVWAKAGKASWAPALASIKGDVKGFMAAMEATRAKCAK